MIGTTDANGSNSTYNLLSSVTPPSQFPFGKVAMAGINYGGYGICSIQLNSDTVSDQTCPWVQSSVTTVFDFSDKVLVRIY